MTTLTLTDAAGTPVNRSYPLVESSPALSVWKDYTTNGGYPVLAGTATIGVATNPSSQYTRIRVGLTLPCPDTVDTTKKAFEDSFKAEFTFSGSTTLQRRKDLKAMSIDLLSDALITSAVESFVHVS